MPRESLTRPLPEKIRDRQETPLAQLEFPVFPRWLGISETPLSARLWFCFGACRLFLARRRRRLARVGNVGSKQMKTSYHGGEFLPLMSRWEVHTDLNERFHELFHVISYVIAYLFEFRLSARRPTL